MGVNVVQLTSKSHHENILASLHQLRLQGQLSDVTVQVDYQGDIQEFQAHQVVLAASSGYFKKILLSQDAARDKLSLSNMHSINFSKFLEFVYTGKVEVARDKIGDVQAAAQLLDCEDLAEVVSSEKEVKSKKVKTKDEKRQRGQVKQRLPGRKVLQRNAKKETFNNENQVTTKGTEENEDRTDGEAPSEKQAEKEAETLMAMPMSDVDEWECEDDVQSNDPQDPLLLSIEEEEEDEDEDEEGEEGQPKETSKRPSKAQFQCNKCQRTFHYERSYLKHISTYHGVKADVIYRCETCLQTFANRSNLKIHEKHVHSNERLFACDSCTKTFKRKKDVVRHQRQIHDTDAPWKNYLVVLEGNVEDKKPKSPTKGKTEKAAERKTSARKSTSATGVAGAVVLLVLLPVTIPSEWTSHGAIALVSHSTLGGITVIHTEVPPGTQIQPIMTTDSTGASVISLDGSSISVPFSIPVSMAHPTPLSSEASSTSLSVPSVLSVPVSEAMLASVTEIPTVSTSSVLEAAVSQTILAPVSDTKTSSEMDIVPPSIQTIRLVNLCNTDVVFGCNGESSLEEEEEEEEEKSLLTGSVSNESIDPLLSQLPSGLMVVVVISPAEYHQAFRLGIPNEGKVLKQLLRVPADPLKEQPRKHHPFELYIESHVLRNSLKDLQYLVNEELMSHCSPWMGRITRVVVILCQADGLIASSSSSSSSSMPSNVNLILDSDLSAPDSPEHENSQ
ncbi:hypothetical protein INR49_027228 [Caranx melampygus]|nr:hypothetical protein INR49_027228 [Caranx melampygus]